jgi:CheY-like chemotaxis protein
MVSQAVARSKYLLSPAPVSKHRVLIVTDCSDRLRGWKASMHADGIEIEITSAGTFEELSRACHHEHDLVVIDVGAASLPEVLRTLRSSVRHSGISLLVEAGRVAADPGLAGLLPRYRAMPCGRSDLLKLAHRLIAGADVHPRGKGMLL